MISLVEAVLRQQQEAHDTRMRNLDPFNSAECVGTCQYCSAAIMRTGSSRRGRPPVICRQQACQRRYAREEAAGRRARSGA